MSGVSFTFSEADVQAYLESPTGVPYLLTVEDDGILATNLSGTTTNTPLPYINVSGGTITGTLNAATISGTTISGSSIIVNGLDAYSQITISANSGLIDGGVLSIGSPTSTFSVTDGNGQISDYWTTPGETTVTEVSWTGLTDLTVDNLATNLITFVAINSSGSPVQQTTPFTNEQDRENIVLGVLVHVNLTNLDAVNNEQNYIVNPNNQFYDMSNGLGFFNINGNIFSANGANLNINKSIGDMWKAGSNYSTNIKNPHTKTLASLTQASFQYRFSNGDNGVTGIAIDPDNLDDGAGGLTAMTNNRWSVQRIYSFTSNNVKIQRGVAEYATKDAAIAGIPTEGYVTEPSIAANGLLRGFLVVQDGATDLSNTAQAEFLVAGKFGEETSGGGGSGGATTLQGAYDNSTTPEIVTSATNGPLTVEEGDIGGDLFDGKDALGNIVFAVGPSGSLTASGNFINKGLNYPTVDGVSGTSITTDGIGNLTFVAGGGSGEINTSSNLGTGEGLASAKVGVDLPFKTISGLSNIELTSDANTVYISGTINTTTQLPEGTNLYYTEGRVDANATVTQNTTDIATVSGVASQNTIDIVTNAGDIATASGVASQNTIDIATNTSDIVYVSGVASQNTIDISTNTANIATVSGVAATAIQNGSNVGSGLGIFSTKNGTNLEFNTVSGVGNVSVTIEGGIVMFSGTGDGAGDVTSSGSITDNSIVRGDGGAKGVQGTGWTISDTDVMVMGSASNVTSIFSDVSTNEVNIAGGNALNAGSRVQLHGNGHATLANTGRLYAGNTWPLEWNATNIYFPQISQADAADKVLAISGTSNIMRWIDKATIGIQSGTSLGSGEPVFSSKNGTNLEFNSISGLGIIEVTTIGNTIILSGSSASGEANTSSNLGSGIGLAAAKAGVNLPFYSVSGVGNVTATLENNVVMISGTATGTGDVVGPASATDNAIAVYNGTTGKLIKNSSATVSDITNNTTNIATVSGVAATNTGNISINTTNIATVSGVAATNTVNIATVSGVATTNTGNISTNTTNIATVSGVAATNTVNIATVSGVASTNTGNISTNTTNIATVSGVAATAIQNATSSGVGYQIFNSKNGTDLVFNTISGAGGVSVSSNNGLITVSGAAASGSSSITTPASTTNTAIALWSGTTGGGLLNSSIIVSNSGQTLNAPVISGTLISGSTIRATSTIFAPVISGTTISGSTITIGGLKAISQRAITFIVDGGGSAIASGSRGFLSVPFACTPNNWQLIADVSGNMTIDVRRSSYSNYSTDGANLSSIVGTEKPTLTSQSKNQDTALTTWSGIAANDILQFFCDTTPSAATRATLTIFVTPA